MSDSGKKDPSSSGGGGAGSRGDGSDEEEEEEEGVTSSPAKRDGQKKESGQMVDKETKRVSIFRFGKPKKKLKLLQSNRRRRRRKGSLVNSGGCFGGGGGGGGVVGGGCCLCLKQPQTLDSSGESPPTSDPNSKEFTYDMLRVFIQKNDFYAADCNPHLDAK